MNGPELPKWVRRWWRRVVGTGVGLVMVAGGVTACGSNNFRDVKGVRSQRPDLIENFNNMDGHPNIGVVCIHGVAFYTTTRAYTSIGRVPAWDRICPKG